MIPGMINEKTLKMLMKNPEVKKIMKQFEDTGRQTKIMGMMAEAYTGYYFDEKDGTFKKHETSDREAFFQMLQQILENQKRIEEKLDQVLEKLGSD